MNKQLQQQNLKQLMRLTLINILNAKGVIYTYYKQQEKELNEHNIIRKRNNNAEIKMKLCESRVNL